MNAPIFPPTRRMVFAPTGTLPEKLALVFVFTAFTCAGLLAVQEQSSSRMLIWPWQLLYWLGPLAAMGSLIAILWPSSHETRISFTWNFTLLFSALATIWSLFSSPLRDQILPWTAWPIAALALAASCTRLFTSEKQGATRQRAALVLLGVMGAFLSATSLIMWLGDIALQLTTRRDAGLPIEDPLILLLTTRNTHPLSHANYTAGSALIFLPVLIALAWKFRGALRWLGTCGSVLCAGMLYSSGSRGALLGLIAMLGLAVTLAARHRVVSLRLVGLGSLALAGALWLHPSVQNRLIPTGGGERINMSNAERVEFLKGALASFADRPLAGWGQGSTPFIYPWHRGELDYGPYSILQFHSTPFHLLAEGGLLALLALALLALLSVRELVCAWRRAVPGKFPITFWTAILAMAGYGVYSWTDYQLDLPIIAATLAILLAMVASQTPAAEAQSNRLNRKQNLAILTSACVGFALLGGIAINQIRIRRAMETDDWVSAIRLAPNDSALRIYAASRLRDTVAKTPQQQAIYHQEAITLLEKNAAARLNPELTHTMLGWLLLPDDPTKAHVHFTEALRVAPNHHSALIGSALASLGEENQPRAVNELVRACLGHPPFLASGWWRTPAFTALRPTVLAHLKNALAQIDADQKIRPSIRQETRYFTALLAWCDGNISSGQSLITEAPDLLQQCFWARLLDPPPTSGERSTALPFALSAILKPMELAEGSTPAWVSALELLTRQKFEFPDSIEQRLMQNTPQTEIIRSALSPMNSPWPYYAKQHNRVGFPINFRHPRIHAVSDGMAHIENIPAEYFLTSLWPKDSWLPNSLLLRLSENGNIQDLKPPQEQQDFR